MSFSARVAIGVSYVFACSYEKLDAMTVRFGDQTLTECFVCRSLGQCFCGRHVGAGRYLRFIAVFKTIAFCLRVASEGVRFCCRWDRERVELRKSAMETWSMSMCSRKQYLEERREGERVRANNRFGTPHRFSVCLSVCLFVCRSVCLSVGLSVCLSVGLSLSLSFSVSVCLSVCA